MSMMSVMDTLVVAMDITDPRDVVLMDDAQYNAAFEFEYI